METGIHRKEGIATATAGFVNRIGVIFLAGMMLLISADVLLRFFFNFPVPGSIELTSYSMLLAILLGMPYAAAKNQHISIDSIVKTLPATPRSSFGFMSLVLDLFILSLVVWETFKYSMLTKGVDSRTAVLDIPIYPFVFVVGLGFALFWFVRLTQLLSMIKKLATDWKKALLWMTLLVTMGAVLSLAAAFLGELPKVIDPFTAGLLGLLLLFVTFLSGLPIFTSLLLIGFFGMCYLRNPTAALSIMGSSPYSELSHYPLSVIILFVMMGEFCFFSGLGRDLYEMAYKWVGFLPGGLAIGTIGACGGFSAVCGDSLAGALTMGTVALPEMKRYKYDPGLATGCVAAGGTLGVLIPPSLGFILYGIMTEQSIGELFISGILPGILMILLFMSSIYVRAQRNPSLGPRGPRTTMKEKLVSLKGIWATVALFLLVIGGLYGGMFTPTEGGGIGAFGALVIGLARGRLDWQKIVASLMDSAKVSAVCMSILVGAKAFSYFLASSKLPMVLAKRVSEMPVSPMIIIIVILFIYLLLGCIMPAIPMLVLTVPIFYPVITALGFDPIWYGVLMVITMEMAVITPPMGINCLALQSISEVGVGTIFRGSVPFLWMMIACTAILLVFPDIATILPKLLK
jgi:tripartite ATP-independent transporter DctM subunit